MTMDNDTEDDPSLKAFFEAGKAETPAPREAFLARLAAEAQTALPAPVRRPAPARRLGMVERFAGLFAASGLTTAAAVGLWIGFISPDLVIPASPLWEEVTALSAFLPGSDLSVLSE